MVAQWMSPSYAARTSSGRSSPESSFLTLFARVEAGRAHRRTGPLIGARSKEHAPDAGHRRTQRTAVLAVLRGGLLDMLATGQRARVARAVRNGIAVLTAA